MEKTIEIRGLLIGYRRRSSGYSGSISKYINISTGRGELVALVGLNGAGKSTLLRTIAGLQKPIDGRIMLCNKQQFDYSRNELARIISFVSTEPVMVPYLKVFDMAAMGRYPYTGKMGRLSTADKFRVMDALEVVGLRAMAWRNVDTLSDGERQRVMIARTLVQDTPIVLFDEPTAFLDVPNKYETLALLRRLAHRQNKTIIYSTHDIALATRTADKLWLMAGVTVHEGAPEDYAIQQAIKELFTGTALLYNHFTGDITPEDTTRGDIVVITKNDPQQIRHALARWGYNCLLNPQKEREGLPKIKLFSRKSVTDIKYSVDGETERHFASFYELGVYLLKNPPAMPPPPPVPAEEENKKV